MIVANEPARAKRNAGPVKGLRIFLVAGA